MSSANLRMLSSVASARSYERQSAALGLWPGCRNEAVIGGEILPRICTVKGSRGAGEHQMFGWKGERNMKR